MPFTSTATKYFRGADRAPEVSGLGDAYNKLSAIQGPNLFESIRNARNNEIERQAKQAQIAKFLVDLQQAPLDYQKKEAEVNQLEALSKLYDSMGKSGSNLELSEFGKSGPKFVNPELRTNGLSQEEFDRRQKVMEQRQKDLIDYRGSENAPMNAESAGRYEFASESLRNIPKIKNLMFKDGKFNQGLVNKAILGKYTKDKDVQDLKRWVIGTLTARGLIQSGTVIKDNEWARLAQQYGIDLFSDPEAALNSLNEQELFMQGFKSRLRPGVRNQSQYLYENVNPVIPNDEEDEYQAWKAQQLAQQPGQP